MAIIKEIPDFSCICRNNVLSLLKLKIMRTYLLRFLHTNFRPLMRWYYRTFYGGDIRKMLGLFLDYDEIEGGIDPMLACSIMVDQEGWTPEHSVLIFGYCSYCGFLDSVYA